MKILYLELNMGVAGDMINAALFELLDQDQKAQYLKLMNSIMPGRVTVKALPDKKCGISGTHMEILVDEHEEMDDHDFHTSRDGERNDVTSEGEEHGHSHPNDQSSGHHSMESIKNIINGLDISLKVRENAIGIYEMIAEAESKVHGQNVEMVHLHEVGALDAICDVTGACLLMDMLSADRVMASPIATGNGKVKTAHGILPVPAPATAILLEGIPSYGGDFDTELTTPTGAAIVKYFVKGFGSRPLMAIEKTGIGCGHKDLPQANIIRAIYGQDDDLSTSKQDGVFSMSNQAGAASPDNLTRYFKTNDRIIELSANIDDMSPEDLSFAREKIEEAGALDVFTTSIGMKKNRMGTLLSVLCHEKDEEKVVKAIFHNTSTIGIRKKICDRYIMESDFSEIDYEGTKIRIKESQGFGEKTVKPEYEDIKAAADSLGKSVKQVKEEIYRRLT